MGFSKSDYVVICSCLVAAAVGLLTSSPKIAIVCLAVGVAVFVRAYFMREKKSNSEPNTSVRTGDNKVGDFRSGDTRTGDININLGQLAPPTPPPKQEEPKELKANVEFLGARKVNLTDDNYQGLSFQEARTGSYRGIVACFRNEGIYDQPTKQYYNVRAHLRFKDEAGAEVNSISGAHWLGSKVDLRNILTDEIACVVVIVSPLPKEVRVFFKERKRTDLNTVKDLSN